MDSSTDTLGRSNEKKLSNRTNTYRVFISYLPCVRIFDLYPSSPGESRKGNSQ